MIKKTVFILLIILLSCSNNNQDLEKECTRIANSINKSAIDLKKIQKDISNVLLTHINNLDINNKSLNKLYEDNNF